MAILDKLLNRKTEQNKETSSQKRLKKLSSLSQPELEAVAQGDEPTNVRCEAVMLLDFGHPLSRIAFDEKVPALARTGRQRIADLIDAEKLTFSAFQNTTNLDQQLAIAALLAKENLQRDILDSVEDQNQLLNIAKQSSSATVRSLAAEKLSDEDAQNELLKHSKGKDKAVYKLIKSKLELQQNQRKQQQATQVTINNLVDAIERHSKTSFDNLYQAKKEHLQQQWSEFESQADDATRKQVSAFLSTCSQTLVDAMAQKTPPDKAREKESVVEEPEQISEEPLEPEKVKSQRIELLEGSKKALQSLLDPSESISREHMELNCKHVDGRWKKLQAQIPASDDDRALYEKLSSAILTELTHVDKHGSIEEHYKRLKGARIETDSHKLAAQEKSIAVFKKRLQSIKNTGDDLAIVIDQTFQQFEQWSTNRKQELEQQQGLQRQITSLLRKARAALNSGKTGPAQGIRASLEEKRLKIAQVPKYLDKQIQELDEQLGKVKDWKEYATLPKKEELLAQMQSLVDCGENPEALATKIKRLQDEWKTLSKGSFTDDGGLWEAFREAADLAFKPCALYFEEQAKQRAENLKKREQVVKQLQDYDAQQDWENPDWRQVAKLVQVAFNEWRSYQPVERSANKPVQEKFDSIIGKIRDKLDYEHKKNKEAKSSLIEQAKALADAEDNRKAIDEVKLMQSRWKELGSASHKADQALWKQFRKHCDAVFEKRKQLSAEFKSELNENKAKVVALCEELEKLGQQALPDLLNSRDRIAEIRQAYGEIGSVPKAQAADLQKRYKKALEDFDNKIVSEKAKAKAGAWDIMLSAYENILSYQQATLNNEESETLKKLAEEAVDSEQAWPKGSQAILKKQLSASVIENTNTTERRLLCIRAEILADLETPSADHSLRMEYQVQQLTKGFGQGGGQVFKNGREALQAMLLEWIDIGPIKDEDYQSLKARINLCRKKIGV